jgi:cell wall-associated NlpC family hydrolase
MKRRLVRIVAALTFGLALTLLTPGYAPGQPSNDIQARAAQLERDLNARNEEVAELGQQLTDAQKKVDEAEARIKVAQDEISRIRSLLNGRAASIYKVAGNQGPIDALNAEDANDVTARAKYSDLAAKTDNELIAELAVAKQALAAQKEEAAAERDAVAKAKADADAAVAEQQNLLDQVKGEIEQALRDQTATRAASVRVPAAPAPLGSGGAGAATAYAQAQVGKSYCTGTSERFGPNCYDCSGLTYMSWRAGGLEIPKVSGAQGSAFPHVDLGSLQPGDLITTSSWGAHVGIWVGGGYVHATSSRNNPNAVKYVAGTGSVVDAVRPS